MGSRSLNGCWTCRLRRKKCDETQPSCLTCNSVGLCCDGYGDVPYWKDGHLKESRYLAVVKSRVKENFRRKCQLRAQGRRLAYLNTEPGGYEKVIEAPISQQSTILLGNGHRSDGHSLAPTTDYDKPLPTDFMTETTFEQDFLLNVPVANTSTSYKTVDVSMSDNVKEQHIGIHVNESQDNISSILLNGLTTSTSAPLLASSNPLTDNIDSESASDTDTSTEGTPRSTSNNLEYNLRNTKERELELAMYYIDTVFYIQFRFHSFTPILDRRGWLYGLLHETKPFYNACLSLSSYADALLNSEVAIEKDEKLRESDEYFSRTITELNYRLQGQLQDTAPSKDGIATVMCIVQLLSLELFRGGTGNWKIHLQAALTLLNRHIPMLQASSALRTLTDVSIHTKRENPNVWPIEEQLLKFAFTVFLWFEIIACASVNFQVSLFPSCKHFLESGMIDLTWMTGCENWVWLQIAEITALLSWKNNSQRLGILSMRELTQRAMVIERRLVERDREQVKATDGKSPPAFSSTEAHDVSAITTIFSSAALTYLHVVVSGPNPHLPEIQLSVSKTLTSLKELRDPQLIKSLAWPFCVTGCLAEKHDYAAVKALLVSPQGLGNIWSAFRVIEECWKLRESEQGRWEWKSVMASLDEHIFLV
ncbi:fungal-specific transcription factor domain-containing protein [Xylogone sp. PMI_703]|nr:fungal-specific transcription factor domain-containing protein [Xylogone sp. PMI_703]